MPRRGYVPKRDVPADPIYGNQLVTKLTNKLMFAGKKGVAERVVYGALDLIRERTTKDPVEVVDQALKNTAPLLEVKPRRVGGATYQVPVEVRPERRMSLALRWLIQYARERGEKTMDERLAGELIDAANNAGGAVRRKEEMHRMAEANRAFAHYRW